MKKIVGLLPLLPLCMYAEKKPNVVIIVADDMGYNDVSMNGCKTISTPNIDRLATEGIRFTDFHSNGALSSPTRAALMTGRYQQRAGIDAVISALKHRDKGLDPSEYTLAEAMKKNGYATGMFGKWHLGYQKKFNPVNHGFDEYIGFVAGNVDYYSHIDQAGYEDWWHGDSMVKEDGYSTDLFTRHAINFIKKNKNNPFFLYIPHATPHYPYQGPKDKAVRSVGAEIDKKFMYGGVKDKEKTYREMIEHMDKGIGQVIKTLEDLKLSDNTIVLFFSDNGAGANGDNNYPLKGGKGTVWEGGHRVPCAVWAPGKIKKGVVSDETVMTMDVFPTIMDFIGGEKPENLDGVSFLPVLKGKSKMPDRYTFIKHGVHAAARKGEWKLVSIGKEKKLSLYNLKEDVKESKDLAASNPEKVKEMNAELNKFLKSIKQNAKK